MRLIDTLESKFGRFAIPNLTLTLIIGQVAVYLLMMARVVQPEWIALRPAAILHGGFWQLFTFLFLPPNMRPIFLIFAWYIFYIMGVALEGYWGDFRYNLFLFVGAAATIGISFIVPLRAVSNEFLYGTVFLAFAYLNPNFELLIFFILPVKIKWLALITWLGYAFTVFTGDWQARLLVLAAVANFLIFFAYDLRIRIRSGKWSMERRAAQFAQSRTPFHTCTVCGRTDKTNPELQFFYSSEGDRVLCYCEEHAPGKVAVRED